MTGPGAQLHARRVHLAPLGPQLHSLQPSFHCSPTAWTLPSLSLHPAPPPDSGVALVSDEGVADDDVAVDVGVEVGVAVEVEGVSVGAFEDPPQPTTSKATAMKLFIMRAAYPRC